MALPSRTGLPWASSGAGTAAPSADVNEAVMMHTGLRPDDDAKTLFLTRSLNYS